VTTVDHKEDYELTGVIAGCYVCGRDIIRPHSFYRFLCGPCGELNLAKRTQMVDLSGYRALVTGGRVKIGFQCVLRLLRCGANVAMTTRFVEDALARLRAEPDFAEWESRVHLIPADFRSLTLIDGVVESVRQSFDSLDILINNAAQTLRRPPQFFAHLLAGGRRRPLGSSQLDRALLADARIVSRARSVGKEVEVGAPLKRYADAVAQLSQVPLLPDDELSDLDAFPEGVFDDDGQQEDRREFNSWMMKLEDVSAIELLEVLYVNVVAPFLLCAGLKERMSRHASEPPSFVVNVSAMEGNFFDPEKNARHPHTNMAKAALNMLTRTASLEFVEAGILMTAVDPGWVTNERPFPLHESHQTRSSRLAIDAVDGAARICDPVFRAISSGERLVGVFLKNYSIHPW
jgi:NAD(P)-dependent dehydrogenase (short-subunit alcohol dehydrogenase family)